MRCVLVLLLGFSMAGTLFAQELQITPGMPVNTPTLHQWLHSGDPRLIAWAATFARDTHDGAILAEMPALLEHWSVPPLFDGEDSKASQQRAVDAVLDALIQENVPVHPSAIGGMAASFPAQVVVLASRLPLSESRQMLGDWSYGATGPWGGRVLARVASMMLAKDPGTSQTFLNGNFMGFVASVVSAAELKTTIDIRAKNTPSFGSGSGACGDSVGHEVSPGCPEVYTYSLSENEYPADVRVVVDLDEDRITFTRRLENGGWGSCYGVKWLDSTTRHRLIAHWLGVEDSQMAWHPVESLVIVWTNKRAYEQQVGRILERQREELQETVQALIKRGYLVPRDAETVSPRLVIHVKCEINPCPLSSSR